MNNSYFAPAAVKISHEAALNLILANECRIGIEGDVEYFEFDLHCKIVKIAAKLISTIDTIKYEIVSIEVN